MELTPDVLVKENSKVITDPIHGTIVLDDYLIKIVNHRYFQRLRHIKQLQGVEHVYPGGVHSRFSHSLGVCFLANRVLDTLKKYGAKIDDLNEKCVAIAALCHDIGHGPFSHLYEIVANEVADIRWKHEVKSMELTKKILEDLNIFDDLEIKRATKKIKTMIEHEVKSMELSKKILEDLELFDDLEIERATKKIKTMIEGKKVEDMTEEEKKKAYLFQDEINMYNMFGLRYTLHSRVLQHKVVCCVHEMIADVLKYADDTKLLKYNGTMISTKECRQDKATEQYCMMDDRLIYLIYYAHVEDERIQKAREIIDRIRDRDFYQCIEEKRLTKTDSKQEILNEEQERTADESEMEVMRAFAVKLEEHLEIYSRKHSDMILRRELDAKETDPTDRVPVFHIKMKVINYGNKDKNPIRNVYFHRKNGEDVIKYVESDSPMIPKCFEEKTIQIICTLSKKCFKNIKWGEIMENPDIVGYIKDLPRRIDEAVARALTN